MGVYQQKLIYIFDNYIYLKLIKGEHMRKKIITTFVVIITIINLIVASLLFFNIQLIEFPETTIKIDVLEMNAEEVILQTTIEVSNTNAFDLIAENFEVTTFTPDGKEVAHISLDGGTIPAKGIETFTTNTVVAFDEAGPETLTTKMTGNVGASIGPIQKTIPLSINVITSLENAIESFTSPTLNIKAEFGEITEEGINLTGTIEVYNPNKFDLYIDNISVAIETENGKNVGNLEIIGGELASEGTLELKSEGRILLEALNAKILFIRMNGRASLGIAGINESVSLFTEVQVKVPDISTLLSPDTPTDLKIKADYKLTLKGLAVNLLLEVDNPNKISIEIRDIVVSIYSIGRGDKILIGKSELGEMLIDAEGAEHLTSQITIPYSTLIPPPGKRFLPDEVEILVRGNVSIPGVDQTIWIGISGIQGLRLFE